MNQIINNAFLKLKNYIEESEFKGYDPYDLHDSKFNFSLFPNKIQFALSQLNKRSPLNARRILGIEKQRHTKAIALFLLGYCNLYSQKKELSYTQNSSSFRLDN